MIEMWMTMTIVDGSDIEDANDETKKNEREKKGPERNEYEIWYIQLIALKTLNVGCLSQATVDAVTDIGEQLDCSIDFGELMRDKVETRTTKQKGREVEGQEHKMMQMLMKIMQQNNEIQIKNRAIVEKLDENSRNIQQMQQNIYEIKQDLDATEEDFRMEIKRSKEERRKHPSKNEHSKLFVQKLQAYLNKIKKQIGNEYDQAMEDAIIREAMRGETKRLYRTKIGEYKNFREFRKGFMRNYWGTKEESVMNNELYGSKFSRILGISREEYALNKIYLFKQLKEDIDERTIVHILAGQLEVEIQNKIMMDETKNFDELLRILNAHDQCERGREKDYANERTYYGNQPNHYNSNQRFQNNGRGRDYQNAAQERPDYRRQVRGEGIENEWNNGSSERSVNVNHIVQQPREQEDRIERVEIHNEQDF
ncbi:hypothetical protein FQA39_LY12249 [Lamprigera yunnana]|nr:hypothetical protein FQA39_LY12249 [Lamprigera yunnana]